MVDAVGAKGCEGSIVNMQVGAVAAVRVVNKRALGVVGVVPCG